MNEQAEIAAHLRDSDRLLSLNETGLLDTSERETLNRYVRIVSRALNTPVSLISLVDDERQFFAAAHGLEAPWKQKRETPLSHSFCQHVVNSRDDLVVNDARNDERVCDNLAISELNVAAYAGVPLLDSEGNVLGSFCVIDNRPRQWLPDELKLLRLLADEVTKEIELERRALLAEKAETVMAEVNQEIAAAHQRAGEQNAAVMHDLRTPLQVVSVAVSSLNEHPSIQDSPALTKTVTMLERNIRQAISLVNTNGRRVNDGDLFQHVDIADLVERVCEDLSTGESIRLDLFTEPAQVLADPMMIRRAVQNLFSNALRFATSRIKVEVVCQDDVVRIIVEDDGDGLPCEEHYERVWELGRRFHTKRSKTGLGLAVTRQLIHALGGVVKACSSELGGARFELILPVARGNT